VIPTGGLGGLDRLTSRGLGLGLCSLCCSVQLRLLSRWYILFAGGSCFAPGLVGFLMPLTRCSNSGLHLHLLAGLSEPGGAVLAAPEFIRQITATLAHAVALVFLDIKNFGLTNQGVDLLLKLLSALCIR